MRRELAGEQLAGLVGLALFIQQFDLRNHGLQVVRLQAHRLLQGVLRLRQQRAVDVQARQLEPTFGGFRLRLELLHELIEYLLQGPEIQAEGVGREAEQCVGGGKAHVLLRIVEQRPE